MALSITTDHWPDLLYAIDPRPETGPALAGSGAAAGLSPLSAADQAEIDELKSKDREVRAHEQAHLAAGAGLITRGASYTYRRGPDGIQYAVGGEVGIDTSPVRNDPAATLRKAERVRSAALAPAAPSPQDRAVAAQAGALMAEAQRAQAQQAYQKTSRPGRSTVNLSV